MRLVADTGEASAASGRRRRRSNVGRGQLAVSESAILPPTLILWLRKRCRALTVR